MLYQRISNQIIIIDTGLLRAGFDASYLIVEGEQVAFVDTGVSYSAPRLLEALKFAQIAPEQVRYVILTHIHLDHAGGAGTLLRALPNAQVVVHPRGARHLSAPERLINGSIEVYGEARFRQFFGEIVPIPKERLLAAADRMALDLNGRTLVCLDTPGHAFHHICIWDERSRGMFTGDTFGLSYREFDTANGALIFPTSTPVHFDPDAMRSSIDLLMAHRPERMYLTHFGCVSDVARLATELHRGVDAYVKLAQDANCDREHRTERLQERLRAYLKAQIKKHDSLLTDEAIWTILEPDVFLNVQGLEIWLERENTYRDKGKNG
ncbi:beta-lactamase domain protein [Candidatus Moduliflexus flocculans]|uniref:Beta-lactamase domain protein n=1 Tax=Candidatus Moduliflexus flocculans TaxID=1499966 RepID=A0A0S6VZB7_9BACT|nr:beta-lactamase domain protein [Candidatus Moduliflexus flocculans]